MTHPAEGKREQIARAIYAVSCRWIAPNFPEGHKLQTFDELDDRERRLNLEYADAALALLSQGGKAPQMERVSLATLAKHFHVPIEAAKLAQDDIGFMYRELAAPTPSPAANAVLVPTEPTQAMISAGQMAGMAHIANAPDDALLADERPSITAAIYMAMVAAFSREESKQP